MIKTPTVLVLGAGASYPYGFPTARQLRDLICDAFVNLGATATRLLGDNSDYSRDDFFRFREAFLKSGQPSVDAFLEHRPEFLAVGKLAIAYCLIPFESEHHLYAPDSSRGGHWYEYLVGKLNAPFDEFGKNQLSIITFNYDRSLEHYLWLVLQNLYGRDHNRHVLESIPAVHVYGQLGKSGYPRSSSRPYLPDNQRYATIAQAAAGITLLHEEPDLTEVRKLLRAAQHVCFLGFSFHELNVARLRLEEGSRGSKWIIGTSQGLIGGEIESAASIVGQAFGTRPELHNLDNLMLLRTHSVLR